MIFSINYYLVNFSDYYFYNYVRYFNFFNDLDYNIVIQNIELLY